MTLTTREVAVITYEAAADVVARTLAVAAEHGVLAVATVVDLGLLPVAFGRTDGSPPHSIETSMRKAKTAASTRKPSGAVPAQLAVALEHGTGGILTSIKGGVPLVVDGVCVGGLGIAGGTPDQDEAIAADVLAQLNDQ